MDLATLIGLVVALALVVGSIVIGPSAIIFLNAPSALIVIGGSLGVLLARYNFDDFKKLIKGVKIAFKPQAFGSPQEVIQRFIDLSVISRREGVLALEKQQIEDPFMKKGIDYCVDGADKEKIEEVMTREIEYLEVRHEKIAGMLSSWEDAAPAFGMIGTLIGLVQMLSAMDDPKSIGPAMAVALLTTLYGSFIANVIAAPLKTKLELRTNEELLLKEIIKAGVLGLQHGENPRLLGETLESFISPDLRKQEEEKG